VPRYYFNLVAQGSVIPDLEGVEIPADVAEEVMGAVMEELRSDEPELFPSGDDWSIEVVDELGDMVAKFSR
jgi:hypothetical protein